MMDPLICEIRLQREGFFLGDQSGRDAYSARLGTALASETELDLLIGHYRVAARNAIDWRGVMIAATRNTEKLEAVLTDLRIVAQNTPRPLPSGGEQNRDVYGSVLLCEHGKDRRREPCHGCDPDTYCPHGETWTGCEDRDCVAASKAHLRDLRAKGKTPVRTKAAHLTEILGGTE